MANSLDTPRGQVFRMQIVFTDQLTTVLKAADVNASDTVFCALEEVCGGMFFHYVLTSVSETSYLFFKVLAYDLEHRYFHINNMFCIFKWRLLEELSKHSEMFANILKDLGDNLHISLI